MKVAAAAFEIDYVRNSVMKYLMVVAVLSLFPARVVESWSTSPVDALQELSEALIDLRVTPYYLHQLDRVADAAHFEVPLTEGQRLIAELRERLPGYAVARFVQEQPGERHKTIVE